MTLKERAASLKLLIPAIFIALRRKETPVLAKIMAAITVGYALSPIDLIPDFIPVLGWLDDLLILPLLAALTVRLIPKPIMQESMAQAEGLWAQGKPKKWRYAIPVFACWGAIAAIILYKIMS